jgi:photosystem II stability/assembly factor-like uncharacterized protein
VPITVPTRSTDTQDDRDLAQRVADLEALIEEARRRARRRRRLYAVAVLAAAASGAALLFGIGGGGGGSLIQTGAEGAHAATAAPAPGRWAPPQGPDGGAIALALDSTNPDILYAGGWGNIFKSTNGGSRWNDVTNEPWNRVGAIAVDPVNHRIVYAGTDRGVAKTVDGGRTWRMVNTGLYDKMTRGRYGEGVGSLVIDAHRPQTVYATKQGALFRTRDGGLHWRILGPEPYRTLRCPHCAVVLYGYIVATAIDPDNARTIYASWNRGTSLNFYMSTDGGDTWHRVETQGSPGLRSLWSIVIDANGTLFAAAGTRAGPLPGVVKSEDGGTTWSSAGLPDETVWNLAIDTGAVYASSTAGLWRTTDGGASWEPVGPGANAPGGNVISDPRDPNTMYGVGEGVVKSVDGGRSWAAADDGLVSTLVTSVALAPGSAKILYAGAGGGVFKTTNAGRTWQLERSGLGPSGVDGVWVDPREPRRVYAVESWHGGLFQSNDAGAHWGRMRTPFPSNGVRALAIDPQHPRTIYVADCGGACSGGTLQKTDDGGATWTIVRGVPYAVQSLAVDPHHSSTVFAGTSRGDIFRSGDGGRTWRRVAAPPDLPQSHQYSVGVIVVDPVEPENVYAARHSGGILKSTDGGVTWRRANDGLTDRHVNALTVDPHDPHILYASVGAPGTSDPAAVFRSADGAQTWHPFSVGIPAVGVAAFAVDRSGREVFAATMGDGVIRLRR